MKRTLGVCYYPEHWNESQWAEDAARMARLGLTWVRIGEFAWSRMEPEPGRYDWDWLDRAIATLGARGLAEECAEIERLARAREVAAAAARVGRVEEEMRVAAERLTAEARV